MATRVGILGLGFMGKMHFDTYAGMNGARAVAICDVDAKKRRGDWSAIVGNIAGKGAAADLSGVRIYAATEQFLADGEVDVVDICLPTDLHAPAAVAALKAGKHVICEKPMARTSADCRRMIHAARKARRRLFVAHCIRFWPEYVKAREIIRGGRYGKVISAVFTRVSPTPTWTYRNWALDPARSGGCALDLHIHDADFVLHVFGKPRSVSARGAGVGKGRLDHVVATYDYGSDLLVAAEGAWEYAPTFPFSMTFRIAMKGATLAFGPDGLMLHPVKGRPRKVKTRPGDGYQHELKHFIGRIAAGRASGVLTPESAMQSVKLIEAETASAAAGRAVKVNL